MYRKLTWSMGLCLAAIFLGGTVALADYEAGQSAWKAGQYSEALTQWRTAARAGDGRAMWVLGRVFREGFGVPQDYVLAHMWLNLAVGWGHARATAERKALAAKMTPQQIALAQECAGAWRSGGNAAAQAARDRARQQVDERAAQDRREYSRYMYYESVRQLNWSMQRLQQTRHEQQRAYHLWQTQQQQRRHQPWRNEKRRPWLYKQQPERERQND